MRNWIQVRHRIVQISEDLGVMIAWQSRSSLLVPGTLRSQHLILSFIYLIDWIASFLTLDHSWHRAARNLNVLIVHEVICLLLDSSGRLIRSYIFDLSGERLPFLLLNGMSNGSGHSRDLMLHHRDWHRCIELDFGLVNRLEGLFWG